MQGIHLRKYGVETTIDFDLFEVDGVDFRTDAAHASGDSKVMKDEGAESNTSNGFTDEGQGYSIVLTATEMQAARVVVYLVDSATKVWLDTALVVETYGNASAMHAVDLDDSVRAGLTALPNAAADAAGGVPISDAGGLDIDAKLANTNEVTTARMGALTDWINGGRLDLLLDAIKVVTDAQTAIAPSALIDLVWDEAMSGHVTKRTYGGALYGLSAFQGTAAAGANATITLESGQAPGIDNSINNTVLFIISGTGAGQNRGIVGYASGTRIATVDRDWDTNPDATSVYWISPGGQVPFGKIDTLDTVVDAIKAVTDLLPDSGALSDLVTILADTGELQTDWVNGGRLDLLLDAIPTAAMRGTDSAALASVCTEVRLAALTDWINGGRLDLLLDAIPTTAMRGTDGANTTTPPTAAANADQVWNEARSDHVAQGSFGEVYAPQQSGANDNTSFTATTTQMQTDTAGFDATDDHYNGRIILFTTGVLKFQGTDITDYDGTNKRFTFTALTEAPGDNDEFIVVG